MIELITNHWFAIVIVLIGLYFFWDEYLSDIIKEKRFQTQENELKVLKLEKISQVKMVSDDPKEIEKFITDNAQFLSDQIVKQLVSRIELIKSERVINADSSLLKSRIESLGEAANDDPPVVRALSKMSKKKA